MGGFEMIQKIKKREGTKNGCGDIRSLEENLKI